MTDAQLTIDGGEVDVAPITPQPAFEAIAPQLLANELHVAVALTFRGYCHTCPWEGPDRANNLTALRDFEKHAATSLPHQLGYDWRQQEKEDPDGDDYDRA